MIQVKAPDGSIIQFPDGTPDETITQVMQKNYPAGAAAPAAPAVAAPAAPAGPVAPPSYMEDGVTPRPTPAPQMPYQPPTMAQQAGSVAGYANQTGAVGARETRRGVAGFAGAPVDIVNFIMSKVGLPTSKTPVGGSQFFDDVIGAPATALSAASNAVGIPSNPDPKPQDALQRIIGRAGYEIGAGAPLLLGALLRGPQVGVQAARQMANSPSRVAAPSVIPGAQGAAQVGNDIAGAGRSMLGQMYETAAVAPRALATRELQAATAAGLGAGAANEIAGNPQVGDNFYSDFTGSLAGVGALQAAKAATGAVGNLLGSAFQRPGMIDDIVGEAVTDRIINSSTMMGEQDALLPKGKTIDTTPLAQQLRRPAPVEEAIPGYRANIADRTQDPGLTSFAFDIDAARGGAASARRANNETVVGQRMAELEPVGNPALLRSQLEAYRTGQIQSADRVREAVQGQFDQAAQGVQPTMPLAETRGSNIRGALQQAFDNTNTSVKQKWQPINEATQEVPVSPLVDLYGQRDAGLPLNDRLRFRPSEADVPKALVGDEAGPGTVPLRELQAVRAGLGEDIRSSTAGGEQRRADVAKGYRDDLTQYLEKQIPPELRSAYDTARLATRDMKDRFTRDGDAVAEVLRRREGSGYQVPDNSVAGRFTPPDSGPVKDYRALIREAGSDPRVKPALQDEILADVQRRDLVKKPEALAKYMQERSVLFSDFPELKGKLEQAGVTAKSLAAAEKSMAETQRRLTQPGQSATASYLQYGDENVTKAMRTVLSNPNPAEAARELVRNAGETPQTLASARSALWQEAKKIGQESAKGATGETRWNGRRLAQAINDPKFDAVAKELWKDAPEELADIKKVATALAGAEGSSRARTPGSSGTAQALTGKFDPALGAASVASRARSINRGQLSPAIAGVDLVATWMRRRGEQVQSRAIETMTAAAVNNPGLAAALLEKFNPADYAAKRRMILQKFGVRATQVLNLLDEAQNDDPVKRAAGGR